MLTAAGGEAPAGPPAGRAGKGRLCPLARPGSPATPGGGRGLPGAEPAPPRPGNAPGLPAARSAARARAGRAAAGMERTPIPVLTVQTAPYEDQRPTGGGGLRRPTALFESQRNYLPNFVQSLLSSVDLRDRQGCTMVVGSDGRYFSKTAIEIVVQMAAANGVSGPLVSSPLPGSGKRGAEPPNVRARTALGTRAERGELRGRRCFRAGRLRGPSQPRTCRFVRALVAP